MPFAFRVPKPSPYYVLSFLSLLPFSSLAADFIADNPVPASVEIKASRNAGDERQRASASKSVILREEITRYGDSNLSEVLKRLPGITISNSSARGNEVQMRGLGNGYTQILLNGEATPNGFSIDSIAPDLIERIEVMRTATAEFSTQAIAGTINIVLKKTIQTGQREIKLGLAESRSQLSPNVALQLSERSGNLSYTLAAIIQRQLRATSENLEETGFDQNGLLNLQRQTSLEERMSRDELSLAPRLIWKLENGDSVTSQSFLSSGHINDIKDRRESSVLNTPSEFPLNHSNWNAYTKALRSDLNWLRKLEDSAKLDSKFGVYLSHRDTDFDFQGFNLEQQMLERHLVNSSIQDQSLTLSGKYSAPFIENHALIVGWDGSLIQRTEDRVERINDLLSNSTASSNEAYRAGVKRLALFVQDEWDISRLWNASLGLRWEGLQTNTSGNVLSQVENRSSVFSPLLQTVWKLSELENQQQQVRLALTRTYKAPTTTSLIPRRYTSDNNNNATNPDTQGNPQLRPELAWGLDAAFEQYFGAGALFSASAYLRKIDDVILDQLSLQNGTWISTPANSGQAYIRGLELELKWPLQSWLASAPDMTLSGNLNRNWSRVEQVPGPDNRLDRQAPLSANLAIAYKASQQLSMGCTFSYTQGGTVRVSAVQRGYTNQRRQLDAYAAWNLQKQTQLRLSVNNLLPQDKVSIDNYQDQQGARNLSTTAPSYRSVKLLLEHKF
ncbi:TonB-dependent receptor plug domain-containing protein [Undibacterium sp. Ren11W]|uniref:TonB-dependent receptor plug domain-containing protein n=1 Tax=Undibacterium sp. Ren11W TaxID=3413045 RepID=UPI003BF2E558